MSLETYNALTLHSLEAAYCNTTSNTQQLYVLLTECIYA